MPLSVAPVDRLLRSSLMLSRLISSLELLPPLGLGVEGGMWLFLFLLVLLDPVPAGQVVCAEFGCVFTVSPQVLPHVAHLYESLPIDRADVVPLAAVRCHVLLPMHPLHEGLATIGADKVFLSLVVPHVDLVRRPGPKPFFAPWTLLPFLSGVQGDVKFPFVLVCESLATEGAPDCFFHLRLPVYLVVSTQCRM